MSEIDPFTKRRVLEQTRMSHFNSERVAKEMATEFGSRVGYAVAQGIPRDMAIEACREHFKIVGKAMIDLADPCATILLTSDIEKITKPSIVEFCAGTGDKVTIGQYEIRHLEDGSFWIEHESGEGQQVKADSLEACITQFYADSF